MTLCLFLFTALLFVLNSFIAEASVLNTRYLAPRSQIANSCNTQHRGILEFFVLRAVRDLSFWGSDVIEQRRPTDTGLDDHHNDIFQRRNDASLRRWFGVRRDSQGRNGFNRDAAVRVFTLFVETGGTSPGVPLSDPETTHGRILLLCADQPRIAQQCRDPSITTISRTASNELILCPAFWNRPLIPHSRLTPRDETQFGILVREMVKFRSIHPFDRTPMRLDDSTGEENNANRYMWFLQEIYLQWIRLLPHRPGRDPVLLPFGRGD